MLYPIIMAGGTGTRLWPLSRRAYPKQALKLVGEQTLIQHAVNRLTSEFPSERIFIVTREKHVPPLAEQVPEIPAENFIVEPEGRGTAPAIGLAAIHLQRRDPNAVMAVLTADHLIKKTDTFRAVLLAGEDVASKGYLVTLGIKPTFASTGFGYIRQAEVLSELGNFVAYRVVRFVEKPNQEAAERMIESGEFSWNSGMFIWQVSHIMAEFKRQMPAFFNKLTAVQKTIDTTVYKETINEIWPTVEKETIDYGVMEGAQNVAVIPVALGWSDVGSWASVFDVLAADESGNRIIGPHIGIDTHDTLIVGHKRLIATIGLENLVIVDTEDALLVCTREREQDVRDMVALLRDSGRVDLL